MALQEDVESAVSEVMTVAWNERDGTVVPEVDGVVMKNGAVNVDATYLYADLGDSTGLAQNVNPKVAARIIRAYLRASAMIIRAKGGAIRSYDGDRVMGIFIGGQKNNQAARAALGINWAFTDQILPTANRKWSNLPNLWDAGHAVGVATGKAMIVRGGVHGLNDLVSVGEAPNVAAKLSDIRDSSGTLFITKQVFNVLTEAATTSSKGEAFWKPHSDLVLAGKTYKVYRSSWWKKP